MYISMAPVRHPSRGNNSWFQSKFGADTLTLQYRETSKHCVPNPLIVGKHCDVFIGVFGWLNTSFTILATVDEGFRSPVVLLDQAPQSGFVGGSQYAYYKYSVSVPRGSGGASTPATDIKFSLTPTGTNIRLLSSYFPCFRQSLNLRSKFFILQTMEMPTCSC